MYTEKIKALGDLGVKNIFLKITKEEALNDKRSEYNSVEWRRAINLFTPEQKPEFYKQDNNVFVIYTTDDNVKRMTEISYSISICAGLLREYMISDLGFCISLICRTPNGFGIDQTIKGTIKKMAQLSTEHNHVFTKAIK